MVPLSELRSLEGEPDSGIFKVRDQVHLALHPRYLGDITLGIVNHFNNQINVYQQK